MPELKTVKDLEERVKELTGVFGYISVLSYDLSFYMEIVFTTQVLLLGGDSGIGKTRLFDLLYDLRYSPTNYLSNIDINRLQVILNPVQFAEVDIPSKTDNVFFVDRCEMLRKAGVDMLNSYIEDNNRVVLCSRGRTGIMCRGPLPFRSTFTTKKIDGINCFFIE